MSAKKAAAARPQAAGAHRELRHRGARSRRSWAWARCRRRARRCESAGWKAADLDLIEINEAFAAQACAVNKEMGWDTEQDQRQRRRHRDRPPDRRVGLPHPGDAAARDAAPRTPRRAWPRCASAAAWAWPWRSNALNAFNKHNTAGETDMSKQRRIRHRRHGRPGRGDLPRLARRRLSRSSYLLAGQHASTTNGSASRRRWATTFRAVGRRRRPTGIRAVEAVAEAQGRARPDRRAGQQRRHHARHDVQEDGQASNWDAVIETNLDSCST